MKAELEKRIAEEQPRRLKILIKEFNGGKWGKTGEYIAIVEPEYFKNGKLKKSGFKVVEVMERIKTGYNYGNATRTENIAEVLEIVK